MTIDITPIITVLLDLLLALIGLDFVWCGYRYMKTHETRRIPGLLGYLVLKIFETGNKKSKSTNQFAVRMFSMEAAGWHLLLSGVYLIAEGAFPLLTQLLG